ncbi:MAG: hypothetical protein ACTSYC_11945 [Promethearchaeota archaeon]
MLEERKKILGINEKLTEFDNKVNVLQDLILKMRNDFKIFYETNLRLRSLAQVHERVNSFYNTFFSEIPPNYRVKEQCALIVENKVLKALKIYQMEGLEKALKFIEESKIKLRKLAAKSNCDNVACLTNIYNKFATLEVLINKSKGKKRIKKLDGDLLEIELPG